MITVERIAFGKRIDQVYGRAIQMVVPFTVDGHTAAKDSWIVIYPDKHDIVTDAQFRNRYREVNDETPHASTPQTSPT